MAFGQKGPDGLTHDMMVAMMRKYLAVKLAITFVSSFLKKHFEFIKFFSGVALILGLHIGFPSV